MKITYELWDLNPPGSRMGFKCYESEDKEEVLESLKNLNSMYPNDIAFYDEGIRFRIKERKRNWCQQFLYNIRIFM